MVDRQSLRPQILGRVKNSGAYEHSHIIRSSPPAERASRYLLLASGLKVRVPYRYQGSNFKNMVKHLERKSIMQRCHIFL